MRTVIVSTLRRQPVRRRLRVYRAHRCEPGVHIMTLARLRQSTHGDHHPSRAITNQSGIDNAFFALWLDPSMTFSSALFQEGDDLHTAQLRKLDYLLAAARCHNARRVLDIGCGWGSALEHMVTRFNVQRPVGLTSNKDQAHWAATHRPARIQIRYENWHDHETVAPYDAILSIDLLPHLVRPGLLREERVRAYRRFFAKCRRLLKPDGYLVLQSIIQGNRQLDRQAVTDTRFILQEILAASDFPHVGEVIDATYGMFDVIRLRNDPEHYARTCRVWAQALEARRPAAIAIAGADTVTRYQRYFQASQHHFECGYQGLARIVLRAI